MKNFNAYITKILVPAFIICGIFFFNSATQSKAYTKTVESGKEVSADGGCLTASGQLAKPDMAVACPRSLKLGTIIFLFDAVIAVTLFTRSMLWFVASSVTRK